MDTKVRPGMNKWAMVIIIPCYNEAARLPVAEYTNFLNTVSDTLLLFVNDGSTDDTMGTLNGLKTEFPDKITIIDKPQNQGKAAAVRDGALFTYRENLTEVAAYLDADLATSLEECYSYQNYIKTKSFVFASRILKIGSVVERKFSRFLSGRIIATLISQLLNLKVYDTQCGCKVFKTSLIPILYSEPFVSKWLFDVELFSRILRHYGKAAALEIMEEIPVKRWVDKGDSKVKVTYFFRLWKDLYTIRKIHRKR